MLEEGTSRLNEQIREIKTQQIKKEDDMMEKIRELKEEIKAYESKYSDASTAIHTAQIEKLNLKN